MDSGSSLCHCIGDHKSEIESFRWLADGLSVPVSSHGLVYVYLCPIGH